MESKKDTDKNKEAEREIERETERAMEREMKKRWKGKRQTEGEKARKEKTPLGSPNLGCVDR